VNPGTPVFNSGDLSLRAAGVRLAELAPLIDGQQPVCGSPQVMGGQSTWCIAWPILEGPGKALLLSITPMAGSDALRLELALEGAAQWSRPYRATRRLPEPKRESM
jgi:hypothetical protein